MDGPAPALQRVRDGLVLTDGTVEDYALLGVLSGALEGRPPDAHRPELYAEAAKLLALASAPGEEKPAEKGKAPVSERLVIVAIDAGHGGEDSGARGRRGAFEKDVTLAIARRLKSRIDVFVQNSAVQYNAEDFADE